MPKRPMRKSFDAASASLAADPVYILGIDPGKQGGLASIQQGAKVTLNSVCDMPETVGDLWDLFANGVPPDKLRAYLEQVHAMPGQGVSSMFTFGRGVGNLEMALTAAGIPYEFVTPQKWQKALGIRPKKKGETPTAWKNHLRAHAQRLFPGTNITKNVADAVLIAEYGRRKQEGTL